MHGPAGDGADGPEDKSGHESGPETVDRKTLNDARSEPDEEGVDNEGEEAESDDADGKSEENENRTDERVQETNDERGDEGAVESVDVKTAHQFSDGNECDGVNEPLKEKFHKLSAKLLFKLDDLVLNVGQLGFANLGQFETAFKLFEALVQVDLAGFEPFGDGFKFRKGFGESWFLAHKL